MPRRCLGGLGGLGRVDGLRSLDGLGVLDLGGRRLEDDDLAGVTGHAPEGLGQVAVGADDARREPERDGERGAVQQAGDAGVALAGAGELGLDQLEVVGYDDQPAVAQQALPRRVLHVVHRRPGQPTPGPAEPDPDPLRVGDEQRGAGVDEADEPVGAQESHRDHEGPVEHRPGLGGATEVGDGDRGGGQPDAGGDGRAAAYLHRVGSDGERLVLPALGPGGVVLVHCWLSDLAPIRLLPPTWRSRNRARPA